MFFFQFYRFFIINIFSFQEITNCWKALGLPIDVDNKILKYTWTIPLAMEYDMELSTFENVLQIIDSAVDDKAEEEYPNIKKFIDKLKHKWSSRIKYVLSYPKNECQNTIEAYERRLQLEFSASTISTPLVLGISHL